MNQLFQRFIAIASFITVTSAYSQTPALGNLYPSAPPEGSSFVRVVNPFPDSLKLNMVGADVPLTISGLGNIASNFKVVNPTRPFSISINGKPLLDLPKIAPNSWVTLVLKRNGEGFGVTAIADSTQGRNALKVDLRVYNLASGCLATVTANQKIKVFGDVAEGTTQRRSINPVAVDFNAKCSKESAPLSVSQWVPGTSYSLFIVGDGDKPILAGKADAVD